MKRCFGVMFAALVLVVPASAHFVFISPEGKNLIAVVFSEDTQPDENVPVTKIAQTKLYSRSAGEALLPMTLNQSRYTVPVDTAKADTVGGTCVYGVLQKGETPAFLLTYHAKTVLGANPTELLHQAGKAWTKLPLDVVVAPGKNGYFQGRLLWQGKPARKCEVIVDSPGQKREKTESDAEGFFYIGVPKAKGMIRVRGKLVEEKAGKHDGKDYKTVRHYVTFTIPSAIAGEAKSSGTRGGKATEDPAATKLLKDARAARATWGSFPGFTANLSINHNGQITKTKVIVDASGKVDLQIADEAVKKFVRSQIISLVAHRMSNASEKDTPCAFADKNANHPLGQKILVLNDELHSSYRIKDKQIIEVNRQMEKTYFTITVLKNYVTPEKKFLPAYYVVNTWRKGDNQLINSTSHHHTWKRIGKYDLPESLTIVTAKGTFPAVGELNSNPFAGLQTPHLDAWTITFTNVALTQK